MSLVVTVAVGTYEGGLLVYKVDLEEDIHLRSFSSKDASGTLKSMLFSGRHLYTAGRDEAVRVYDTKRRIQQGVLTAQNGTVEKLLHLEDYLFVACSDGTVVLYGTKDNAYYHTLYPHNKSILDMDIHRSGRLMVSYAMDKKLKLTDLASVKEVYHKNINKAVDFVRFAPDDNLLFTVGNTLNLFNSENNTESLLKKLNSRITCLSVLSSLVLMGDDSGYMHIGQYPSLSMISFRVYTGNRVKAFNLFKDEGIMVTISTEGTVSVWDVESILAVPGQIEGGDIDLGDSIHPLHSFTIESRLITLACRLERKKETEDPVKLRSSTLDRKGILRGVSRRGRLVRLEGRRGHAVRERLWKLKREEKIRINNGK